jgi:hypothetical protein
VQLERLVRQGLLEQRVQLETQEHKVTLELLEHRVNKVCKVCKVFKVLLGTLARKETRAHKEILEQSEQLVLLVTRVQLGLKETKD